MNKREGKLVRENHLEKKRTLAYDSQQLCHYTDCLVGCWAVYQGLLALQTFPPIIVHQQSVRPAHCFISALAQNRCCLAQSSEGGTVPSARTETAGASRYRRSVCISRPWTLCVSLIFLRSVRRRANVPSLNPELSTCSLQGLSGMVAAAECVDSVGGWTEGRVLTEWADCLFPETGGCEDPLEDGSSCVAVSDSSSELDRSLFLEMHKTRCIIMWNIQFND